MAKFISIFYKRRNSVNRGFLILLYNSLIYPHLTYCNTVVHWSKNIIGFNLQNTEKIVRIITFSNGREHCAPLLKSCNKLKIIDINRNMTSILVYRSLFSPEHPGSDLFGVYNGAYNTRFSCKRLFPACSQTILDRLGITNRGPQIYNDIQCHCKSTGSMDLFKLTLTLFHLACPYGIVKQKISILI